MLATSEKNRQYREKPLKSEEALLNSKKRLHYVPLCVRYPLLSCKASFAEGLTTVEVEAISTAGNTDVGALVEVEPTPARGALVTTATNAGLTRRGALLAALPVITEKTTGALGDAHPALRGDWKEARETG